MRLLVSLALAASTVVAFKQLRQDSRVIMAHDQISMDSAINDLRNLHQVASAASHGSMTRRLGGRGGRGSSSGYRRPSAAAVKERIERNSEMRRPMLRTQSLPVIKWRTHPKAVRRLTRQRSAEEGNLNRR
ncbi:hypothetical protein AC1031_006544 [Aphanomyces cochlioides]|nr:hypothetical protein AC1031_006544 [Aphanomyces cochlioides]